MNSKRILSSKNTFLNIAVLVFILSDYCSTAFADNALTVKTEVHDGLSQYVRIVEKTADVVTSDKRFIWCDGQIAEERNANNESMRYYFGNGETRTDKDPNPGNYYYTSDHLGSTQTVLDSAGTIVARYEYTPYGEVTRTQGTLNFDFLYTGHYRHEPSNLFLTHYRAYDPTQGRWLSRDPISENGGINLYAYVENDPINAMDPLGLVKYSISSLSQLSCADQAALFGEFGLDGSDFSDNLFAEAAGLIAKEVATNIAIAAVTGGTGAILTKAFLKRSKRATQTSMSIVSRWGKTGPLQRNDWLMKGPVSRSNFFRSFKWDPNPTNMRVPFKNWNKGENHLVFKADIKWPAGAEKWKGIFGQRQYRP